VFKSDVARTAYFAIVEADFLGGQLKNNFDASPEMTPTLLETHKRYIHIKIED
jgi:hypothetical protein